MNKQHKYEFGIKFSFIIVVALKCQLRQDLHTINICTRKKIFVLIVLKCGIKKYTVVSLFSIFLLVLFFLLAQGREGVIIPTGAEEEDWGGEKKVIFSFICLRKSFAVSSPSKTRIKGTEEKINDIVTEVLSLSLPMIFELYWWIVIRYFSLAALLSVLNAYHLVLDDSVTDSGLEREGRRGAERERKPLSNWKAWWL